MNLNRLAVNIYFGVCGFLFANYISRLPKIQSIYQMDNGDIGLVLLISAIGALIAMPLTGWLIVNKGSRMILMISGLLLCMVVPFIGNMPGFWALSGLFFIIGLATGVTDVSMNAQAIVVENNSRRPIMSFFHALFSAGMMAGALAGTLFTKMDLSLNLHLGIISAMGFLSLIWAMNHLVRDFGQLREGGKIYIPKPEASLIGIGLIAFCCMLGEGAMANWSTNYMLRIADADTSFAPLGLVAFSLSMMIARFFGDRVRAAVGDRSLLIANSFIASAGLALVLFFPHPFIVLLGLLFVGLGLSVVVPIVYSTAGKAPGLPPGAGIGMVTTIGYAGLLLGPPVIGFLADWQGLRVALSLILVLFVLMFVLSYRIVQTGNQKAFS